MTNIRSAPWRTYGGIEHVSDKMEKAEKYRTGNTATDLEDFYTGLPITIVKRTPHLL